MSLRGDQQRAFVKAFARLLLHAEFLGYKVTFPPEHTNHIKNSYHYIGLAKDINLFKDGKYIKKTNGHLPLGIYWELLGGTWGGRFRKRDGNHYSWGERR